MPIPSYTIDNVDELAQSNFSLLFTSELYKNWARNAIVGPSKYELMGNVVESGRITTTSKALNELVTGYKKALLCQWNVAIKILDDCNTILDGNNKGRKQCKMLNTMIESGIYMYVFLPPTNAVLAEAYQRFFDAGIVCLWTDEYFGWSHSKRVQDRARVKSRRKLVQNSNMEFPLKDFNRKIINSFYVFLGIVLGWVYCCLYHRMLLESTAYIKALRS